MIDVDLFAGAGGASTGLAALGLDPVGFEWNPDACTSHHSAGHRTIRADLSRQPWTHLCGRVRLMHGSPPCQPFSAAGDGAGEDDTRDGMPWMLRAIVEARPEIFTIENVPGLTHAKHQLYLGTFLRRLSDHGYNVDWRILNAADFGVPQTRHRLIIVGRLDGDPRWPEITHVDGGGMFHKPWVSMSEALGWDRNVTLEQQRGAGMIERYGERPERPACAPAFTVTARSRQTMRLNTRRDQREDGSTQTRLASAPAPALAAVAGQWVWERPATTVAGDVRISRPGHDDPAESGSQQRGAVRVELHELATLQGFPPGYPFHGNRTSVARQIGNALPPALIAAVVQANGIAA